MSTKTEDDDPQTIFAMQLANAAELAATLNLTIDCNGKYISVMQREAIINGYLLKELYSDTSIQAILGWLDGVVYERNRIRNLS